MASKEQFGMSRRQFLQMAAATGGGILAASQFGGLAHALGKSPAPNAAAKDLLKPEKHTIPTSIVKALQAKNFNHLEAQVSDLSWKQLSQHIGLYNGYVKKFNSASTTLKEMANEQAYSHMREVLQKQSYALNGVVLHDLYFSNLGGVGHSPHDLTMKYIMRDFGSFENYLADLKTVGKSMRGWAVTGFNMLDGRLYNYGLDAHDVGTPLRVCPLLVLDVYEHAYMIDFGTNRGAYLDVFLNNLNWSVVEERLQKTIKQYQSCAMAMDM